MLEETPAESRLVQDAVSCVSFVEFVVDSGLAEIGGKHECGLTCVEVVVGESCVLQRLAQRPGAELHGEVGLRKREVLREVERRLVHDAPGLDAVVGGVKALDGRDAVTSGDETLPEGIEPGAKGTDDAHTGDEDALYLVAHHMPSERRHG